MINQILNQEQLNLKPQYNCLNLYNKLTQDHSCQIVKNKLHIYSIDDDYKMVVD